mmetsp:Transcript_36400/g.109278  ORF Transcript_36400/g.109278 Transcript_36400/m.109278 type:complete len:215 (+) Transcript_36400:2147-2791(+)
MALAISPPSIQERSRNRRTEIGTQIGRRMDSLSRSGPVGFGRIGRSAQDGTYTSQIGPSIPPLGGQCSRAAHHTIDATGRSDSRSRFSIRREGTRIRSTVSRTGGGRERRGGIASRDVRAKIDVERGGTIDGIYRSHIGPPASVVFRARDIGSMVARGGIVADIVLQYDTASQVSSAHGIVGSSAVATRGVGRTGVGPVVQGRRRRRQRRRWRN